MSLSHPLPRELTRPVHVGGVQIGGGAPVVVQSMTCTDTADAQATLAQVCALAQAGCDIVRVSVPTEAALEGFRTICAESPVPIVADIHFNHKLAIGAVEAGAAKLRINPGNIGGDDRVKAVATVCREKKIPIRIGVNSGSVEKSILAKYGAPTAEALCESALYHASLLEKFDFTDIVISLKSSSVDTNIKAYERIAERCDYPLHLGVTEAGGVLRGAIKSSVGMGVLLSEGIGDTLRVSLTAAPEEEMTVAWELLRALGLRQRGPEIISCPTCGRTEIDLIGLAQEVERRLRTENAPIKVAVMGCVVNGPGEAREADLGMAGGRDKGIIFRKGEVIRSVRGQEALLAAFMEELDKLLVERRDL